MSSFVVSDVPSYDSLKAVGILLYITGFVVGVLGGVYGFYFYGHFWPMLAVLITACSIGACLILWAIATAAIALRDIARNSWYMRKL